MATNHAKVRASHSSSSQHQPGSPAPSIPDSKGSEVTTADKATNMFAAALNAGPPLKAMIEGGLSFAQGSVKLFRQYWQDRQNSRLEVIESYGRIYSRLDPGALLVTQRDLMRDYLDRALEDQVHLLEGLVSVARQSIGFREARHGHSGKVSM